jgi:dTDP-4-dehydrorhamnose reductase
MRKVFITGDAGMLGHAISEVLKKDNNYKVLTFPELETYENEFHYCKGKKVKKSEVDVENIDALKTVFSYLDSNSIVINCAAYVNTDKCENFSYEAVMSNVIGTQNIIELCKDKDCTLIHFSTTAVFDPDYYMDNYDGVFNEKTLINPKTIYGATKYASELAVKQSLKKFIIMKPVFIYGNFPYDNSSNISRIMKAVFFNDESKSVDITLSNEFKKNYMHSDYFALMMKKIIDNVEICYGEDFIISRDPKAGKTFDKWLHDIAKVVDSDISKYINQIPEKDYLKNHLGYSENFYSKFPDFKLPIKNINDEFNIIKVYNSIVDNASNIK